MIGVPQVDELVGDDVVDEAHRRLDNPPVEAQHAASIAAGPAALLVADHHFGLGDADLWRPLRYSLGKALGCVLAVPGFQRFSHDGSSVGPVPAGPDGNIDPPAGELGGPRGSRVDDLQPIAAAEVQVGLARNHLPGRQAILAVPHLAQPLQDPSRLALHDAIEAR